MGGERGRKRAPDKSASSRIGTTRAGPSSTGRSSISAPPQGATGAFEFGPVLTHDDVLELQRTAGNRAVSTVVQRAAGPTDETGSSVAVAEPPAKESVSSESGPAQVSGQEPVGSPGPTTIASFAPGPARPAGTGSVSQPAGPEGVIPVGGGGPVATGGPVEPGFAGAVDQDGAARLPRRRPGSPRPRGRGDVRSRSLEGVPQPVRPVALRALELPEGAGPRRRATARVHRPAASSPSRRTTRAVPPRCPRTAATTAPGSAPRRPGTTRRQLRDRGRRQPASAERPFTRAIAPGFAPGPEPAGRQTAAVASHEEVVAALAADPRTVVRSPNDAWHAQGYELDKGNGSRADARTRSGVSSSSRRATPARACPRRRPARRPAHRPVRRRPLPARRPPRRRRRLRPTTRASPCRLVPTAAGTMAAGPTVPGAATTTTERSTRTRPQGHRGRARRRRRDHHRGRDDRRRHHDQEGTRCHRQRGRRQCRVGRWAERHDHDHGRHVARPSRPPAT